jgi:hypothetical protein
VIRVRYREIKKDIKRKKIPRLSAKKCPKSGI